VDSPCHKLPLPHKGVLGEGGGVFVVLGRRVVGDPVLDDHVPSAGLESLLGFYHEIWRGSVRSGRGGGV